MGVVRNIEDDQAEANRITAEDLQETARGIFTPENLRLVAVGPWKPGMKKLLRDSVCSYEKRFTL
jgi:predicted Zn-dependent peptidase